VKDRCDFRPIDPEWGCVRLKAVDFELRLSKELAGEGGIRTPGTSFSSYNGLANRHSVTVEAAGSSPIVPAILSKRLTTNFERMAWYTTRYTSGCTFLYRRTSSLRQDHFHNFLLRSPLLVCHGVRVDVHGDVAKDHITRPRRLGGRERGCPASAVTHGVTD